MDTYYLIRIIPIYTTIGDSFQISERISNESRYATKLISAVYVSDLIRSYTTATCAFENQRIPIISDARLREWNYGDYNGICVKQLENLKKEHIENPFPNGESLTDVLERFRLFENQYLRLSDQDTVLIIGHRATYYALEHYYNHVPLKTVLRRTWNWQPGWRYTL